MKLNEKFDVTLGGLICLLAPIVAISVGGTWAFLKASEWSMSAAIATKLSHQAALNASDWQELTDLRTKVAELQQNAVDQKSLYERGIADAQSASTQSADRLKSVEDRNKKLTDALAAMTGDSTSIKVPTGEARFIADKRVAVGVESVSVSFATVRIGDYSSINMFPGESRSVQLGDNSFVVTLMKIDTKGCVFAVRKA